MKIHYYSHKSDRSVSPDFVNFGDDLNDTLWDELFPGLLDSDATTIFSGIGSHLNSVFADRFAESRQVVFGTGYGYGDPIGSIDDRWKVYFVRGPLTAESMGLDASSVITDAAMLIRLVYQSDAARDLPVSFMPHISSLVSSYDIWSRICKDLGFHLIDVRSPLEQVLGEISRSEVLLTEALHGAIISDALRTPWIPFISNTTISELKWRDFCASIDVPYTPFRSPSLWRHRENDSVIRKARLAIKYKRMRRAMQQLSASPTRVLSSDSKIEELTERLSEAAEQLRKDHHIE